MEDILASIRRIIADDQSRHAPAFKRQIQTASPRIADAQPEPVPSADPPPPEATVATLHAPRDGEVAPRKDQPVPHLIPSPAPEPHPVVDEAAIDAIANAGAAAILRPTLTPAASFNPAPTEPPPRSQEPFRPSVVLPGRAASPDPVPQALVSPSTAAGIESSFQTLATTVFLQNTDMVETMVRDMLRPMLKTWLDDNLPTVVERLVRAEIERVARGGRG